MSGFTKSILHDLPTKMLSALLISAFDLTLAVLWDVDLCRLADTDRRFRVVCCLIRQGHSPP
jgi:hypothetical protein